MTTRTFSGSAAAARFRALLVASLLVSSLSACEQDGAQISGASGETPDAGEMRFDYRMILAGAISDTLRGRAVFGNVITARNRSEQLVVKLETGVDFVGGLFITRRSRDFPERGQHPLADVTSSEPTSPQSFFVIYREGLLRQLRSRAGTVTFDVVSDTLITGTLEATLAGLVATRTGLRPGEVHVSGQFSAHSGIVGFLIGL